MFDQLQAALPSFGARLSETIVWCTGQPVESNPVESNDIRARRRLSCEASELVRRAFLSGASDFRKTYLYWRGMKLLRKAKIDQIIPPLAKQLRSSILQPQPFTWPQTEEERMRIVETVAEKRADELRRQQRYPPRFVNDLHEGRLLLYAPDENLCDGAAEYSSLGFFDVNNIPPWDTWICFFQQYLVSWVPPQLLELAGIGIDVNPELCILWAPEAGLPA